MKQVQDEGKIKEEEEEEEETKGRKKKKEEKKKEETKKEEKKTTEKEAPRPKGRLTPLLGSKAAGAILDLPCLPRALAGPNPLSFDTALL